MYQPQDGDEGNVLILAALRDYLAADTTLVGLLATDENGDPAILPEGTLTAETDTPVIMFTTVGDGRTGAIDDHMLRLLVYALDRGRGYMRIERILARLQYLFNKSDAVMDFLTFPPGVTPMVLHLEDSGGSDSQSFPKWNVEGRGRYVQIDLAGVPEST